jgi:hypothetical protein
MSQTTTTTSKQFRLNLKDLLRGLLIAAVTASLTGIYEAVTQCGISCIDWKQTGGIALAAGLAYLIKNFLTPAEIVVMNPPEEQLEAVKHGEATVKVTAKKSV